MKSETHRHLGAVSMTGRVSDCKRVDVDPEMFRVGFEITSMSRIDRGRWQATLEALSDA